MSAGSVTAWIGQLQAGDESVLARLHERYWPWLVALARKKMKGARLHQADAEDVAQQAFLGFYQTFKSGGAPRLASRQDLLALLTTITARKAINQVKKDIAGVGGQVRSEWTLLGMDSTQSGGQGLQQLAGPGPTPLEEVILQDQYRYFVEGLPAKLRDFAELYLAGCKQREIAEQLHCSLRNVERKIAIVLGRWQEMAAASVKA